MKIIRIMLGRMYISSVKAIEEMCILLFGPFSRADNILKGEQE